VTVAKGIDRLELQRLVERGAQLVEVLGKKEYDEEHVPGAINIPLRDLDARAPSELDRSRPVVVYCYDSA
jgi:rhodanese-related sulfurtransferase